MLSRAIYGGLGCGPARHVLGPSGCSHKMPFVMYVGQMVTVRGGPKFGKPVNATPGMHVRLCM